RRASSSKAQTSIFSLNQSSMRPPVAPPPGSPPPRPLPSSRTPPLPAHSGGPISKRRTMDRQSPFSSSGQRPKSFNVGQQQFSSSSSLDTFESAEVYNIGSMKNIEEVELNTSNGSRKNLT
ncbi:hypothetical protein PanWU01x14_336970, partial [Parasponia andersonii]